MDQVRLLPLALANNNHFFLLEKLQKNKKIPIKKLPFPVKSKYVPVDLRRTIFEKAINVSI